jgi:hypothetical protein
MILIGPNLMKLCFYVILLLLADCTNKTSPTEGAPPSPVDVRAVEAKDMLLDVGVKIDDNALILHIENVPDKARLVCKLGDKEMSPCHHDAHWRKPPPGEYSLIVKGLAENNDVVAAGQTMFSLLPPDSTGGPAGVPQTFDVVISHDELLYGETWPTSKDLVLQVALANKDDCMKPDYECRYGDMWRACTNSDSELLSSRMQASGLQEFRARARCGDSVGREAKLVWYGVDNNYERLKLMVIPVLKNPITYVVRLWRGEDCPDALLTIQESSGGAEFSNRPPDPSVVRAPAKGLNIRAKCGETTGPTHVF